MNKQLTFILTTLLFFSFQFSFAQEGFKLGGFFMPQGSVLLNQDDMDLAEDVYQTEVLGGVAAGAIVGYNFNDNFGIRANVMYSQEGGRYTDKRDEFFRNEYVTRLEYVKIPVMIGYNADPFNNKVMLSLYAGPQISFLSRGLAYNDNPEFDPGVPDNFSNFPSTFSTYDDINYSLVGDFGVDIYLTPEAVMNLHLRLDYSLNDVEDKEVSYQLTENGSTTTVPFWSSSRAETNALNVGLLVGITFTIGGYY
ncbi:MAG: porin family protein [Bacteroidota bacterium]